jgi:FKBP-type peptidyl-prolyl cis-trans isomerase
MDESKVVVFDVQIWLSNGSKLYSTKDVGGVQDEFRFGKGEVPKGVEEGVRGMREGGIRKLFIPSELAFSGKGTAQIPPNTDMVYIMEFDKSTDFKRDEPGNSKLDPAKKK